jgi:predicted ATP-grasp superfamily ATP-dependent carboligase
MIYQNTGPSGCKLAEILDCSVTMPYNNQDRFKKYHRERKGKIELPPINYGCGMKAIPLNSVNFNSQIARNKIFAFKVFKALGIKYPELIDNPADYDDYFIGRKNNSSQGQGIVKFKPKSENWNKYNSDFFVKFINGKKEMRVHVWGDYILMELNKDFGKNSHGFIRNFNYGSKLVPSYIDHKERPQILEACKKVINYCGLTYGAVDIIVDDKDDWYFLEVNSAPKLSWFYAYIYAEHINRIYNLDVKFRHYIDWKELTVKEIPEKFYH